MAVKTKSTVTILAEAQKFLLSSGRAAEADDVLRLESTWLQLGHGLERLLQATNKAIIKQPADADVLAIANALDRLITIYRVPPQD